MQINTNIVTEQNRKDDALIKFGTTWAKLNTIILCFLIGLSVIKLINNAVYKLSTAAVIVQSVCFMPCMVATGSWGTQLALDDKE